MATNLTNKNSFDILKLLMKKSSSLSEILDFLEIKAPTFYKHLSNIKKAGFEINKNENMYKIK